VLVAAMLSVSACGFFEARRDVSPIQTEMVLRRDLDLTAEATGVIEPVEIVDIKSKAAGQVIEVAVETGIDVKPGDLLVRIDPREVEQRYQQALASRDAARYRHQLALANRERNRTLFAERVLSEAEFQQGASDSASAATGLMSAEAALVIAQQQREDATIRATVAGTIIAKLVAVGAVIQSSTSGNSAGTNLLQMADLTKVRIKASFNETDIANIRVGLPVDVRVDAFPDEVFMGTLEKIEPIAQVQQSVTMFPVQVAIDNSDRRLKPGMNAEVSVKVAEVFDVLAVPSDAVRTLQETEYAAGLLKLNPDSVRKQVDAQVAAMTGMGANAGTPEVMLGQASSGDVDISLVAFQDRQGRRGRGGRGGRGGFAPPTEQECAPIKAAYEKNPAAKAKLDSLRPLARAGNRSGGQQGGQSAQERGAEDQPRGQRAESPITVEMNAIYATLGVNASLANRCALLLNAGRTGGAATQPGNRNGGAATAPDAGGQRFGAGRRGPMNNQLRIVFISDSGKAGRVFTPRVFRPGLVRYDYTEVLEGIVEGERVVLMQSAQLAADQERNRANAAARAGGPLGQPAAGGRGPGGGGGGGRGGRGGGNGGGGGNRGRGDG
jgi:HlyD family secretion protein